MTIYSDEERFYMADNLLLILTDILKEVFVCRWNQETGKIWDDASAKEFASRMSAHDEATPLQISTLSSFKIEEWDVSLLALAFKFNGPMEKYKGENKVAEDIHKWRLRLAKIKSRGITKEYYSKIERLIQTSMKQLGRKTEEVEKMFTKVEHKTSLKALKTTNGLFERAEKYVEKIEWGKALELYTRAIETPGLLNANLGRAYETRANVYFSIAIIVDEEDPAAKCFQKALLDAKKAIELNRFSWVAYKWAAHCYRHLENLSEALNYYQHALEKIPRCYPNDTKILQDLVTRCKRLICRSTAQPQQVVKELNSGKAEDPRQDVIENDDAKLKERIKWERSLRKTEAPGEEDFLRGKCYYLGNVCTKNFEEAVKHFNLAANQKHAEAMFFLARCYQNGEGVEKDKEKAMVHFMEVAEMDVNSPGVSTLYKCNRAVAWAQTTVGTMHKEKGDYKQALSWWQKGMANGDYCGSQNLGYAYLKGRGIDQDMKMAELCFKESINLTYSKSYENLIIIYLDELEPDKAASAYCILTEELPDVESKLKLWKDQFWEQVEDAREQRSEMERQVENFEWDNNLDKKGHSFKQRLHRALAYTGLDLEHDEESTHIYNSVSFVTREMITEVFKKATGKNGSVSGKIFTKIFGYSLRLKRLLDVTEEITEVLAVQILELAYNVLQEGFRFVPFNNIDIKKVSAAVECLYNQKSDRRKGVVDRQLRLCYGIFNEFDSFDESIVLDMLKKGILRYSNVSNYYVFLCITLINREDYEQGLEYAKQGLEEHPENLELLFLQFYMVSCLSCLDESISECEVEYQKFFDLAPEDDPLLPDAQFEMADLHLQKTENDAGPAVRFQHMDLKTVGMYCWLGLDAEEKQLPCYLPYGNSLERKKLEMSLRSWCGGGEGGQDVWNSAETAEDMKTILEMKTYLKAPTRQGLLKLHRQNLHEIKIVKKKKKTSEKIAEIGYPPKLKQVMTRSLVSLKPITLDEMNVNTEQIYEGRMIQLAFLEQPIFDMNWLVNVAEDENGDVTRVLVKNFKGKDIFSLGCRVAVINPYMSISDLDGHSILRIDNINCVICLQTGENMCGFCGSESASHFCSSCKRSYCSEECKALDAQRHDHKLVCWSA